MPATPSGNKGTSTLFAFTPRQVLLSNQTMKHKADNGTLNLKPSTEQKLLLHQSIAHYLERSGFSKTLKKFRSEAQIEKDGLEGSSVDLEEMCLKYLELCRKDAKSNINDKKEQGVHSKNKEEGKSKEKKKKKSKLVSESLADNVEENQLESPTTVSETKVKNDVDAQDINGAETEKKSKNKMKKKDKPNSEGDAIEQIRDANETVSKKEKASTKEAIQEEKKDSKKRKRQISEENGQQVAEIKADEETKRRKINANLGSDLNSNKESNGVSSQVSGDQLQKTPNKETNGKTNGHDENAAEESSVQKSQKKQHKASVEQKSAAKVPFQRVQADKVEFVDERLQDNSYWAKGGAEKGYGAKAEEILGQVRGRDFRHEKTKKKRGAYRGGHIDLQSHSVKFNYSDDE